MLLKMGMQQAQPHAYNRNLGKQVVNNTAPSSAQQNMMRPGQGGMNHPNN